MGMTADMVVIAALTIGYPTRETASTPRMPRLVKCERVNDSAKCKLKSTEMPTRIVSEIASTMPNFTLSATKIATTARIMASMLSSAMKATKASPVKMNVAKTANASDTAIELTVPLMACSSVAMRTQDSEVTFTVADGVGGAE